LRKIIALSSDIKM